MSCGVNVSNISCSALNTKVLTNSVEAQRNYVEHLSAKHELPRWFISQWSPSLPSTSACCAWSSQPSLEKVAEDLQRLLPQPQVCSELCRHLSVRFAEHTPSSLRDLRCFMVTSCNLSGPSDFGGSCCAPVISRATCTCCRDTAHRDFPVLAGTSAVLGAIRPYAVCFHSGFHRAYPVVSHTATITGQRPAVWCSTGGNMYACRYNLSSVGCVHYRKGSR